MTQPRQEQGLILIVDDARLNRELLRRNLARHGYQFLTAANGREAVEVLTAHPEVDIIILDLMMPVMDGFDFLRWRNDQSDFEAIPVIVNSSLDDWDSLAQALRMDSYDYFTKPLSNQDLELILPLKIRNAVRTRRLFSETQRQNENMRRELELAGVYQQFLLPRSVHLQGVRVSYLFHPCTAVGGDYFDFFQLAPDQIGFVVADVSGHGMASAMTASIIKALMPGYLENTLSPARALTALNTDLIRLTQEDAFVTAFAGVYRIPQRELVWAVAGHPPAILLTPGEAPHRLSQQAVFLGIFESQSEMVDYQDQVKALPPQTRLCMYTDGLIEAPSPTGQMFGMNRLIDFLARQDGRDIEDMRGALWQELNAYVQGDFPDDVAFILMDFENGT